MRRVYEAVIRLLLEVSPPLTARKYSFGRPVPGCVGPPAVWSTSSPVLRVGLGAGEYIKRMPSQIFSVPEVKRLLKEGAQLVDVLGPDEFEHDHLPGAINVPLKELDKNAADQLDRTRPVLVYCNDFG